jgi:hypothetical protein
MQSNKNPYKKIKLIAWLTITLSVIIWIVAACLPAYFAVIPTNGFSALGITCFIWGALAVLLGPIYGIIWSANIFGLVSFGLLARKKHPKALKFSIAAFVLSLCSLLVHQVPADENGGVDKVTPGPAAYLWILSMATILIGSYAALRLSRKLPPEPIEKKIVNTLPPPPPTDIEYPKKRTSLTRTLIISGVILVTSPITLGILIGIYISIKSHF